MSDYTSPVAVGAQGPPEAFAAACPSRLVMARVSEKWALLALVHLAERASRFGALKRRLEGVSQKMLTQTLRGLERDGLITRRQFEEMPVRVEYELTEMGRSLLPHAMGLKAWAEANLFAIAAANAAYDARDP